MIKNSLVYCNSCGNRVQMVFVHSHYQCPVCRINIHPCCEGENSELNEPGLDLLNAKKFEELKIQSLPKLRQ